MDVMKNNATCVINSLKEMSINNCLVNNDILVPSAREMCLLILQLFLNLPHFIPKASIEFSGILGDLVLKTIELTNPSKKQINYNVRLEGSNDFLIDNDLVTIEGNSTASFPLTFKSRISSPV